MGVVPSVPIRDDGTYLFPKRGSGDRGLLIGGQTAGTADIIFGSDAATVFNEQGNDANFRIEGDTDVDLFFVDAGTNRIGISTNAPDCLFEIEGELQVNTAGGADSIKNKVDGSGLILTGLGSGVTADLRIVANTNAFTDNVHVAYFQIDNSTNRNATILSGTYGADANFARLYFGADNTQFSSIFYSSAIPPTAVFEVVHDTEGEEIFKLMTQATNDDINYRVYQERVTTTDATVTTLDTIAITASYTYLLESRVVARRTGGVAGTADDGAVYIRRAMITTKSGTVTINATQDGLTQEDQAGWDCTLAVSGANILLRVTGAVDNNITWHSTTILQHLGS